MQLNNNLFVFGAGGHAKSCLDIILDNGFIPTFVGQSDDQSKLIGSFVVNHREDSFGEGSLTLFKTFVGVGLVENYQARKLLIDKVRNIGPFVEALVSPRANVSSTAQLGEGTIVMPGAVIGHGVTIGSNSIVNSGAIVEHESQIGSNVHISTGAIINGNCYVNEDSFIGSGAILRNGVSIKSGSFVRMGETIKQNIEG